TKIFLSSVVAGVAPPVELSSSRQFPLRFEISIGLLHFFPFEEVLIIMFDWHVVSDSAYLSNSVHVSTMFPLGSTHARGLSGCFAGVLPTCEPPSHVAPPSEDIRQTIASGVEFAPASVEDPDKWK